jgi:hypothetical protein
MAESEVLTRENAAPKNILPTGRKVGVMPVRGSGRYRLGYVDSKPGALPAEYQGEYTGIHYAEQALQRFVTLFWDMSDNEQKKKK